MGLLAKPSAILELGHVELWGRAPRSFPSQGPDPLTALHPLESFASGQGGWELDKQDIRTLLSVALVIAINTHFPQVQVVPHAGTQRGSRPCVWLEVVEGLSADSMLPFSPPLPTWEVFLEAPSLPSSHTSFTEATSHLLSAMQGNMPLPL